MLAAERGNGATVYLVADDSRETVASLVAAARRGAGLSGEPKWLSLPEARSELGWHPLHPELTADAETYARANRA